ncbi:cytochrome P450 [Ganoderma sinense ZZ0214-1]|uniref:Cytochrome P450 n=1 Tax=Ganoderma sinense ZZ0214-1 TaxID=1077348 RepID=A0A2G8SKS8_9APHY|nr:cytochrome P450 [Ganoderma sinense ZZ0214-1]
MAEDQAVGFICIVILVFIVVYRWNLSPLNNIPTVGSSWVPGLSYLSAIALIRHLKEILQDGYTKYYGSAFKIPLMDRWMVIVSGPKMIEDIRRRPEYELSFTQAVESLLQYKYNVGSKIRDDPYHLAIVKEKLQNRMLADIIPDMIDEVSPAVQRYIPANGKEWVNMDVSSSAFKLVTRTCGRVFAGSPMCNNEEYIDLSVQFALEMLKAGRALRMFPDLLKPIAAVFINKAVKRTSNLTMLRLRPIIRKRIAATMREKEKDRFYRPNDALQWIIDKAVTRHETDIDITERLLLLNLAASYTSSSSLMQVLYHLAEWPELLAPLREEIEGAIAAEGWTMPSFARMWKLDSILRESQRCNGFTLASLVRIALKDVVLDNGMLIPKGTLLGAPAHPMHYDNAHFPNAHVFDPFRFARMREAACDTESAARHQFASTSPEYLPFGHGQLACPGRHFASNQLKAVLSHIILNYDLKLPEPECGTPQRPPNEYLSLAILPPTGGTILVRKRAAPA